MPGLVGHRLIFVTGKGGVGKSTVSAALAIASAMGALGRAVGSAQLFQTLMMATPGMREMLPASRY